MKRILVCGVLSALSLAGCRQAAREQPSAQEQQAEQAAQEQPQVQKEKSKKEPKQPRKPKKTKKTRVAAWTDGPPTRSLEVREGFRFRAV